MKKLLIILFVVFLSEKSQCQGIIFLDESVKPIITVKGDSSMIEFAGNYYFKSTFFTEWQNYISDCNELVADTITQNGTVTCELVPVQMNGKIVSYNTVPVDTVWDKCDCNNYKFGDIFDRLSSVNWAGSGLTLLSSNSWYSEPTTAKNTFEISRDKICQIKKRKASFDDFVERWCVEQKLIELN